MMMMMKDENDVRNCIADVAEDVGWHVSHIESGTTSPGIPDLSLTKDNVTLWLEIKVDKNGEIHMRPPQRRWHRKQYEANGTSYVIAWINGRLHIIHGNTAAQLAPKATYWKASDSWDIGEIPSMLRHLARILRPL